MKRIRTNGKTQVPDSKPSSSCLWRILVVEALSLPSHPSGPKALGSSRGGPPTSCAPGVPIFPPYSAHSPLVAVFNLSPFPPRSAPPPLTQPSPAQSIPGKKLEQYLEEEIRCPGGTGPHKTHRWLIPGQFWAFLSSLSLSLSSLFPPLGQLPAPWLSRLSQHTPFAEEMASGPGWQLTSCRTQRVRLPLQAKVSSSAWTRGASALGGLQIPLRT